MNEWIIQTFSLHSLMVDYMNKEQLKDHVPSWRPWCDAVETHRYMEPTTLEAASERMISHFLTAKDDSPHTWSLLKKTIPGRVRLYNVVTKEEIPIEVFNLI